MNTISPEYLDQQEKRYTEQGKGSPCAVLFIELLFFYPSSFAYAISSVRSKFPASVFGSLFLEGRDLGGLDRDSRELFDATMQLEGLYHCSMADVVDRLGELSVRRVYRWTRGGK